MKTTRFRLTATLPATALALLLQHPAIAADAAPAPAATVPPASAATQPAAEPAAQTQQPVPHPAQAIRAKLEEQRAAHMAELQKRYEELRAEATGYGFEMSPAPFSTAGPQWMSYDEMRELMKAQGVEMPTAPSADAEIKPAPMAVSPRATRIAEARKRLLETFEQMTPEEKRACFVLSRRHGAGMRPPMHPAYSRPPMPQYPQGQGPGFDQPYPGMVKPYQ